MRLNNAQNQQGKLKMLRVVQIESPEHLQHYWDTVAELRAWYSEMLLEVGLDINNLFPLSKQPERNEIPVEFSPPSGCLLLASYDRQAAGCGGLRRLTPTIGEINRIYVRPVFRGKGIGRTVVNTLIANARQIGYATLRLNTASFMKEAHALYYSVGFKDIAAYREIPDAFKAYELFMELTL
jgi:GNAT superfamily N-acetyltransferase